MSHRTARSLAAFFAELHHYLGFRLLLFSISDSYAIKRQADGVFGKRECAGRSPQFSKADIIQRNVLRLSLRHICYAC